jgi:hypothetical protein
VVERVSAIVAKVIVANPVTSKNNWSVCMANRPQDEDDYDDEVRPRRKRPRDDDDDDEPRSRRSPDDDDEAPRRRRRDDDDYDDEPPRRRRRQDEDDYDDEPRPRGKRLPREKLRKIAVRQKILLFCLLAYILCGIAVLATPAEIKWLPAIPAGIAIITCVIFVFLVSIEVDGPVWGTLLAMLTPCFGLIIMVVVNQRAIGVLNRHGIHVGFMGANLQDI